MSSKVQPSDAGTKYNLPADIREVARLRGEVVAWTHLDPALEKELGTYMFWRTCGPFVVMPCLWLHLCILCPCLCCAKIVGQNAAKSQYWVLTEKELKVISMDHDKCCCPGICKSGNNVKTIPVDNITDCGLDAKGNGCANKCSGDLPVVYVDTASGGQSQEGHTHEAVGLGLANYEWFIDEVMNRRNDVKNAPSAQFMSRPSDGKSVEERMAELTKLRDMGILTSDEYEKKRNEIIASI